MKVYPPLHLGSFQAYVEMIDSTTKLKVTSVSISACILLLPEWRLVHPPFKIFDIQ